MMELNNGNEGVIGPTNEKDSIFAIEENEAPVEVKVGNFLRLGDDDDEIEAKTEPGSEVVPEKADGKEKEPDVVSDTFDYKTLIVDIYGEIGGVLDEEGNEISFEDLNISSKDEFVNFIKSIRDQEREEDLKDKVDVSKMSDFMKNLVAVEKNGGNVNNYINLYNQMQAPIDKLDVSNEDHQVIILDRYYRMKFDKISDDDVNQLIEMDIAKNRLSEKAIEAKDLIDRAFNESVEKQKEQDEINAQKKAEFIKDHSKKIKANLDASFELNDSFKNRVVDFAVGKDEKNTLKVYSSFKAGMNDPEKAGRIALFLMDPEEYDKQVSNKVKVETTKRAYRLSMTSSKERKGGHTSEDDEKEVKGPAILSLED